MEATGDRRLLNALWPSLVAADGWMSTYADVDGDGYVEYERKNPRGLFHQGWKDGSDDHLGIDPPVALVEVQGYTVAAKRAFGDLASRRGEERLAGEAREAASQIESALNRDFWMADAGYYALALDGKKRVCRAITSNPGHLLLAGFVPEERVAHLARRLFRDDLWTPFGVRTHSSSEPDFNPLGYHTGAVWPHDNWFLWRGLRAVGRGGDARKVRDAMLRAYEALGKIPELYAVVDGEIVDLSRGHSTTRANPLQAWSLGTLFDMLSTDDTPASP